MVSERETLGTARRLQENIDLYKENNHHAPYFTLTSEGAKALKRFYGEIGVRLHGVEEVDAGVLQRFFVEKMNIEVKSADKSLPDGNAISILLGAASRGIPTATKITIDTAVLNALSEPRKR